MKNSLSIHFFEAANIMKLVAVHAEIAPKGEITRIVGKNANGKTSLLTAILLPFMKKPQYPEHIIRKGQDEAEIKLDIRDDADALKGYDVFMKFRRDLTTGEEVPVTIRVTTKEGVRVSNPEAFLKKLVGSVSINLSRFLDLHPQKQFEEVSGLIGLKIDIEEWKKEKKRLEDARRDLNVAAMDREKSLKTLPYYHDAPKDLIDTKAIREELTVANQAHIKVAGLASQTQDMKNAKDRNLAQVVDLKSQIEKLTEKIGELGKRNDELDLAILEQDEKISDATANAPDANAILARSEEAEEINKQVQANAIHDKQKKDAEALRARHADAEKDLQTHIDDLKLALAEIKFPIKGMRISEDFELCLGESTFGNASFAEQLTAALTLEFMRERKLPFITVSEGTMFDPDSQKVIQELAEKFGYQVILEEVQHREDQPGIIIQDGSVLEVRA